MKKIIHYIIFSIILASFISISNTPYLAFGAQYGSTDTIVNHNKKMIDILSSTNTTTPYLPVTVTSIISQGEMVYGYTCETIDNSTNYSTELAALRSKYKDDMSFLKALYDYMHDTVVPSSSKQCVTQTALMLTQAGYVNALAKSDSYMYNLAYINNSWYILDAYDNIAPTNAATYSDYTYNYIVFSYNNSMIVIDDSGRIILTGINAASTSDEYITPDFVTDIGHGAFYRNKSVKTLTITSNVTYIHPYAFNYSQLSNINFEDGDNSLEILNNTFNNVYITKLVLPKRVTSIEQFAFTNNSKLKELTIQGNPNIQGNSFARCSGLEKVNISASLAKIPANVFANCNIISNVYYSEGASEWAAFSTLSDNTGNETLFNSNIHYYDSSDAADHVHSFTKIDGREATCTTTGKRASYLCTECGKLFADSNGTVQVTENDLIIRPAGHVYGEQWITDSSMHYPLCSICNSTENTTGNIHSFVWITDVAPTESEYGLKHEECTLCHYKRKENTRIEKLHVHSYIYTEAKAATCTEPGNTAYYNCSGCGELLDENKQKITDLSSVYIPVRGHDWIPLRYNDTEHYMECDICKKRLYVTPHKMKEVIDKKATVNEPGSKHNTCTICGYSCDYETIDKLPEINPEHKGHTITYIPPTEATCTKNGNIGHYKCMDCNSLYMDAGCYSNISNSLITTPVIPHQYSTAWEWDDTNIYHYHKCVNCGARYGIGMHEMTWIIDSEPQIGIAGSRHIECITCGKREEENTPIPALTQEDTTHKHRIGETIEAKAPTCTEYGQAAHYVCVDCGMCYTNAPKKEGTLKDFLIAPLGHSYSETIDENGHILYCFRCKSYYDYDSLTLSDLSAATPHTYEWVIDTEPTIEHGGKKHRECTVCGYKTDIDTSIEMLHIYNTHQWSSAHPTGSDNPDYHFHRCIYYYCDKHIDMEPHEFEWVTDREPTYYEKGSRHIECIKCGYYKLESSESIPMLVKSDMSDNNDTTGNNDTTHNTSDVTPGSQENKPYNNTNEPSNYPSSSGETLDKKEQSSDEQPDEQMSSSADVPNKPTKLKLKSGKKSITVSWKKVANVKGYEIRYSTKSSMKGAKKKTVKKASITSATIKKLKKGKKYYVRVYSYVTDSNGKKIYSKASNKKSIKIK